MEPRLCGMSACGVAGPVVLQYGQPHNALECP